MKTFSKSKGFTLVEFMVAAALFSFVVAISSGVLVMGITSQKKSLAGQDVLSQASYLMEYMSRAIRMAQKDITGSCIGVKLNYQKTRDGQGIKFKNYQGICQEFYLAAGRFMENKNGAVLPLTSEKLDVADFNIGPDGSWDQNDYDQPKVTLFLEILGKEESKIKIQTTISQRNLDIQL